MIEIVTGEAAQANVAAQPIHVMLFGGPGTLKTTDACELFMRDGRSTAFFIPFEDNALKAIASRGWPVPDHPKETVKGWTALYEAIGWFAQHRSAYAGLILDGWTALTNYLYKEAEEQHKGNKNKFAIPSQVRTQLLLLREWIRQLNVNTVLIAHPLPPVMQDGIFYPGAFAMSPKTLIDGFFGATDTVLRVDYLSPGPMQPPVRVYYTGGQEWPAGIPQPPDWRMWRTKNREGCAAAVVPANLKAFLSGRQPPYAL